MANGMGGAAMHELFRVGHDNLIREIIHLEGDSGTQLRFKVLHNTF
jgi:V-type H+-transporting ATPase subunit A